jgi:ferrous iron transport protein B
VSQNSNKILLVGNPNVGKSVIFAYLTGRYAVVSNYPGTTVEVARGPARFNASYEVIDTPGVNSLLPKSEDEKATRDLLVRNRGATVVQIADAKNLFRALMLTSQLAELGCRMILVLNMMDEAKQRGIAIDTKQLSAHLGIEVVRTVAVEKTGLGRIVNALSSNAAKVPALQVRYDAIVQRVIDEIRDRLPDPDRFGIFGPVTVVSGDAFFLDEYDGITSEAAGSLTAAVSEAERRLPKTLSYYIASARREVVERLVWRTVEVHSVAAAGGGTLLKRHMLTISLAVATVLLYTLLGTERLAGARLHPALLVLLVFVAAVSIAGPNRMNRATTHPLLSVPILVAVLYLVYMAVGVFAAGTMVDAIERHLFGRIVIPAVTRAIDAGWLREFLVGEFGLISMGLNYSISIVLPIVTVFFLAFGILEDTGYFPRLTVLTNNAFKVLGMNGKATLPVVLGFGCVTMATLASRILETKKERIIVVTLLALAVPCSAQLGVTLALASAVSVPALLLIAGIILAEFVAVGRIMSILIKGAPSDFILELPPLRSPKLSNIVLKTWTRVKWFLREALPFFLLATVILFILDVSGGLRLVYAAVRPVLSGVLGLPVETAQVFIIGFFRRDYGAAGLYKLWESGMIEGNQLVVSLLVMSLFLPCFATLIVMVKELGFRWAFGILLFVMFASLISGAVLNLLLNLTGIQL